jgi:hypothetical protein
MDDMMERLKKMADQNKEGNIKLDEPEPRNKESAVGNTMAIADADRVQEDDPDTILQEARKILEEYGNNEAEIPITSNYWALMNAFRTKMNDEKTRRSRKR